MSLLIMMCRECIIDKNARIGKNVVIANSEVGFFISSRVEDMMGTIPLIRLPNLYLLSKNNLQYLVWLLFELLNSLFEEF